MAFLCEWHFLLILVMSKTFKNFNGINWVWLHFLLLFIPSKYEWHLMAYSWDIDGDIFMGCSWCIGYHDGMSIGFGESSRSYFKVSELMLSARYWSSANGCMNCIHAGRGREVGDWKRHIWICITILYIYIHIHTYIWIYRYIYTHIYIYLFVCLFIYIYISVCTTS